MVRSSTFNPFGRKKMDLWGLLFLFQCVWLNRSAFFYHSFVYFGTGGQLSQVLVSHSCWTWKTFFSHFVVPFLLSIKVLCGFQLRPCIAQVWMVSSFSGSCFGHPTWAGNLVFLPWWWGDSLGDHLDMGTAAAWEQWHKKFCLPLAIVQLVGDMDEWVEVCFSSQS